PSNTASRASGWMAGDAKTRPLNWQTMARSTRCASSWETELSAPSSIRALRATSQIARSESLESLGLLRIYAGRALARRLVFFLRLQLLNRLSGRQILARQPWVI